MGTSSPRHGGWGGDERAAASSRNGPEKRPQSARAHQESTDALLTPWRAAGAALAKAERPQSARTVRQHTLHHQDGAMPDGGLAGGGARGIQTSIVPEHHVILSWIDRSSHRRMNSRPRTYNEIPQDRKPSQRHEDASEKESERMGGDGKELKTEGDSAERVSSSGRRGGRACTNPTNRMYNLKGVTREKEERDNEKHDDEQERAASERQQAIERAQRKTEKDRREGEAKEADMRQEVVEENKKAASTQQRRISTQEWACKQQEMQQGNMQRQLDVLC